ncbi:hypothetical protein [Endothiovibrio diazotrophicus]
MKWFSALDGEGRGQLLAFAEFLYGRRPRKPEVVEPREIPRPTEESVVKAIRRLSESYPMLDRGKVLHETSMLMSQHVMQGRPAVEVVDDLELLFRRHYGEWRQSVDEAEGEDAAAEITGG